MQFYSANKVEGKLRFVANPHCEQRMELLLKQMEEEDKQEKIEEDTDEEDDVSQMYYGENCTCSKNSMCKSSKCLCFLRTQKCTQECHGNLKTKCTNK